jgi:mannose-6-phosphate isomerase-like protein (cupin superfamily)
MAALTGCMPQTTVRTGMSPPALMVAGAPTGSVLFVDGLDMGSATQYDGNPKVLAVLEGTHQVEVRLGSNLVYKEKVFVSSGQSHTVAVGGATSP